MAWRVGRFSAQEERRQGVVNGARPAADSALTAELTWRNGWSAGATFDSRFSDTTRGYAGKGTVRYAW